jgi:hypothetical protein
MSDPTDRPKSLVPKQHKSDADHRPEASQAHPEPTVPDQDASKVATKSELDHSLLPNDEDLETGFAIEEESKVTGNSLRTKADVSSKEVSDVGEPPPRDQVASKVSTELGLGRDRSPADLHKYGPSNDKHRGFIKTVSNPEFRRKTGSDQAGFTLKPPIADKDLGESSLRATETYPDIDFNKTAPSTSDRDGFSELDEEETKTAAVRIPLSTAHSNQSDSNIGYGLRHWAAESNLKFLSCIGLGALCLLAGLNLSGVITFVQGDGPKPRAVDQVLVSPGVVAQTKIDACDQGAKSAKKPCIMPSFVSQAEFIDQAPWAAWGYQESGQKAFEQEGKNFEGKCVQPKGKTDLPVGCLSRYRAEDFCTNLGGRLPSYSEQQQMVLSHTNEWLGVTADAKPGKDKPIDASERLPDRYFRCVFE